MSVFFIFSYLSKFPVYTLYWRLVTYYTSSLRPSFLFLEYLLASHSFSFLGRETTCKQIFLLLMVIIYQLDYKRWYKKRFIPARFIIMYIIIPEKMCIKIHRIYIMWNMSVASFSIIVTDSRRSIYIYIYMNKFKVFPKSY